jgi:hypothetical protein
MWMAAVLIMQYFLFSPIVYQVVTAMRDAALQDAAGELLTFVNLFYPIFYYAYPALTVWGLIMVFLGFIGKLRRRYYAVEEVGRYSY